MRVINFITTVSFCSYFLFSCSPTQKKAQPKEEISIDSSFAHNAGKNALEIFVQTFSDSLNHLSKGENFPKFLEDPYFDYNHIGIWSAAHSPISLRKEIMTEVKNCSILREIINRNEKKYRIIPGSKEGITADLSNLSWYDLVSKQYNNLHCDSGDAKN